MKARPTILVLLGSCLGLLVASAGSAQLANWNQERVTKLAAVLKERTAALYDTFYKEPVPTIGTAQARSYYRVKELVRRIRREARQLSDQLDKGAGREETLPIYENLMTMVRDAQEEARRTFTSDTILNSAASAGDALRQISPYYDPEALRNPVREAEEGAQAD